MMVRLGEMAPGARISIKKDEELQEQKRDEGLPGQLPPPNAEDLTAPSWQQQNDFLKGVE